MNSQFFCPRWGSEHLTWQAFAVKVKETGYNGVEYAIASITKDAELDDAWNELTKQQLLIISQHYDTVSSDFNKHYEMYHQWLERISKYPHLKIDSQTGKDFFSVEQNSKLIALGNKYKVLHETHRGKFSFAAHITKQYLQSIPDLRITLDASHWCNVAESFLEDQQEAMDIAIERTDHIHARVGYPEGPQVSDPSIPEWAHALAIHCTWWDKVAAIHKSTHKTLTITPEFGAYPYMARLPGTEQPISDQWGINKWMMEYLRNRFQ